MPKVYLAIVLVCILASCSSMQPAKIPVDTIIPARSETVPISSDDDPAIWVYPDSGHKNLILGTDKNSGSELKYVPIL